MPASNILFQDSTQITDTVTLTDWFEVDMYEELLVFLKISAQGTYANETLDVTIQVKAHDGDAYDVGSFDQITDKTSSVPYRELLPVRWFGTNIRIKITLGGDDPDYTIKLQGYVKRT